MIIVGFHEEFYRLRINNLFMLGLNPDYLQHIGITAIIAVIFCFYKLNIYVYLVLRRLSPSKLNYANMAHNPERRKLLEQIMPESMIVTRKWLAKEASLDKHAIDNLVKSEQLKLLWKGLYTRRKSQLSWQSMVYTLQAVMKTDFIVGGLTALELKGFSHYIPVSKKETVHLYGNDKLPAWANKLSEHVAFIRHTRNELFSGMEKEMSEKYTAIVSWKLELDELRISCPERACLEMLNEVPGKISMEHADQLIQGMTTLSPRTLQQLLEACTNVKVKRLFLWFASRHNYIWFSKLNIDKIDLGSGNRLIVKGGELDKTYQITVPKDFQS